MNLSLPISFLAEVEICASGEVVDLHSDDSGQALLFARVRDYMKHSWKFYPDLSDGKPVASELQVLFRFHAHAKPAVFENEPEVRTVIMIHFYPRREVYQSDDSSEPFAVFYGFADEGSQLSHIQ